MITHGHSRNGKPSKTYDVWSTMKARCYKSYSPVFKHYGGRGIRVCDRWHDFRNFLADMGEKPEGLTLDRIDVDGDYEPGNCRWATKAEQAQNRRGSKLNAEKVVEIRRLYADGASALSIARKFSVRGSTVDRVVRGEYWKNVPNH